MLYGASIVADNCSLGTRTILYMAIAIQLMVSCSTIQYHSHTIYCPDKAIPVTILSAILYSYGTHPYNCSMALC
jgi:hypothetical protein